MIELPLVWRLVPWAVAFGTLQVVLVGWLIQWWAGSSRAAVLLRSDLRRRRRARVCRVLRRAARPSTRIPAGAGRAPDRPAPAGHRGHDQASGA
ncbi:MAG: hypothetical protein ACRDT0_05650 [Pseudonocardiaceae bacterium]